MLGLTGKAAAVFTGLLLFASFSAGAEVRLGFLGDDKCRVVFKEYGERYECKRATSSSDWVGVIMSGMAPGQFSSICAESEEGVRLFCFLMRPKTTGLWGFSEVGRKEVVGGHSFVYPVPYASEPFPEKFILKYDPGAVRVEFFAETNLRGERLGVFDVRDGQSISTGSGASRAKSATILGLGKHQQLCIRTVKDTKRRCYQGAEELLAGSLAGANVNDLNATEAPPGFRLEHEGQFENDIYLIDSTPKD